MIARATTGITKPPANNGNPLSRDRVYLMATKVQDRFGNYVEYGYLGDQLRTMDFSVLSASWQPLVCGRRTWLFAGSNRGGDACAIAMSLIATAKAHGHESLAYLT